MWQTMDSDEDNPFAETLWPPWQTRRSRLSNYHRLPTRLARIYVETNAAIDGEQAVLAAVGIRAIVEAVCKHKRARGRNLKLRINDLVSRGILTKKQSRALHKARLLGNSAAHEVSAAEPEALEAAMSVGEHMLTSVYLISGIAKSVSRARPTRSSTIARLRRAASRPGGGL
jgi:hypothetical protein